MSQAEGPLSGLARALAPVRAQVQVDSVDIALLKLLSQDSRVSQRRLAREVDMSAPAVGERLARLERMGVIQGYTVAVDWALLGYPVVVYLPVVATAGADLGQLILTLGQQPEVEQISVVSGAHDLMVRLRVRDHAHLSEILLNRIWQIPGVQRTETLISLAEMHPKAVAMELLNELEKPHD